MEKINFDNNGQWDLTKTDHRLPAEDHHSNWVWDAIGDQSTTDAAREAKRNIPAMVGEHRDKSLNILGKQTQVRSNPDSGEREFLLHRGGHNLDRQHDPYERTSWTPVPKTAHRQAYYDDVPGQVASAWIPENQLHSGLAHYTYKDPQTQRTANEEQEWLVTHKKDIKLNDIQDARRPKDIK